MPIILKGIVIFIMTFVYYCHLCSKIDKKIEEDERQRKENLEGVEKGFYLGACGMVREGYWDDGSTRILGKKIYKKGELFLDACEGITWKYDDNKNRVPMPPIEVMGDFMVKTICSCGVYREGWTLPKGEDTAQKLRNKAVRESAILCFMFCYFLLR